MQYHKHMKDKIQTFDFGIFIFACILIVIFSNNVGLVFLIRVVTYMLKLYVHQEEITNHQMFKIVLFSIVFAYFHIIQELAYILGFCLKCMLPLVYGKLKTK